MMIEYRKAIGQEAKRGRPAKGKKPRHYEDTCEDTQHMGDREIIQEVVTRKEARSLKNIIISIIWAVIITGITTFIGLLSLGVLGAIVGAVIGLGLTILGIYKIGSIKEKEKTVDKDRTVYQREEK